MPREHDPSFVELFVKNQRRVYGYIMTVVPDCNEADDLFQQTSMVLWEKAGEFRPDGDFLCWACGIAHNVVRNWRVKKRRDRHCFSDELVSRIAQVYSEKSAWLEEALAALGKCMDEIEPFDRQLLDLCYKGDRSIREISQELGRTEAAVYQRLYRVRARLLDCIQQQTREEAPR